MTDTNSGDQNKADPPKPDAPDNVKPAAAKPDLEKLTVPPPKNGSSAASKVSSTASQNGKKSGGKSLLWFLMLVILVAGSVMAGWPYIGDSVKDKVWPMVADVRMRLGFSPRSEPGVVSSAIVSEQTPTPLAQAPTDGAMSEMPVEGTPAPSVALSAPSVVIPDAAPSNTPVEPVLLNGEQVPDIAGLVERLTMIEEKVTVNEDLSRSLQDLRSVISALNGRLDKMDAAVQDLSSKQSRQSTDAVSAQALVLAATQLRVRLLGGASFSAELNALERIAGHDPAVLVAVGRLRPHAEGGVPSKADLALRFTTVAADIVRAKGISGEPGWMGAVKDSLFGLVTVRRTDPKMITNEVDRAIAVAEAALQVGALDEAVQALSTLQGSAGEAVAAWLGDARARVDAEAALETLYNQALAAMAQVGGN
ncbi:MAG: hypothetical protein JKY17_02730 [Magnetovibrio sp.]|nr:hypothetical protein [Magnetovibrio sp.]